MGTTLQSFGNLRDLARDGFPSEARKEIEGEDQIALTLEANGAVSEGRNYSDAELYRVTGPLHGSGFVAFPAMLSGATELTLSRSEAAEELALLIDIGDADKESNLYLYSLQLFASPQWAWPKGGTSLENMHPNAGRQAELQIGYFYHEILEGIPSDSRSAFLEWLLESVDSFEASIRGASGDSASHVRVMLKAS